MVKIHTREGLRGYTIIDHSFLREWHVDKEHEWALLRATITLSKKNTWCNHKPSLERTCMYMIYIYLFCGILKYFHFIQVIVPVLIHFLKRHIIFVCHTHPPLNQLQCTIALYVHKLNNSFLARLFHLYSPLP